MYQAITATKIPHHWGSSKHHLIVGIFVPVFFLIIYLFIFLVVGLFPHSTYAPN